jgi:hypothetical protein
MTVTIKKSLQRKIVHWAIWFNRGILAWHWHWSGRGLLQLYSTELRGIVLTRCADLLCIEISRSRSAAIAARGLSVVFVEETDILGRSE